jgi:hypothetical protein
MAHPYAILVIESRTMLELRNRSFKVFPLKGLVRY